jgi:predicted RNA-binding protein YlqC (UPF0109 family)
MPTDTETQVAALLRDLAAAIVSRPECIEVERRDPVRGETLWWMQCAPEDQGKLIGRGGSHARAFDLLVAAMGWSVGETWRFKLPPVASMGEQDPPAHRPRTHDPTPAHELLVRILAQLPAAGTIVEKPRAFPGAPLHFHFDVWTPDVALFRELRFDDDPQSNLVGALGTLFRAAARTKGVRYQINVVPI